MWHLLVVNLIFEFIYPNSVKSAWVEIPQLANKKSPQFVFGSPKVSFHNKKFPTTTPATYKLLKTTPKIHSTTTPNYKDLMTTIQPLTTTPQISRRMNPKTENTLKAPEEFTEAPKSASKANKTKSRTEEINSGFMPLLNTIQETLTHSAKKSLKSKISLLTNLRDNLLVNIDERMGSLWRTSDDDLVEARGHDDHEMDFPSNEGALMTIGFLTFAVFLIKLVLKLIQALKNKTSNVTMMNGTTATAFIGRKRRQLEDEYDNLKILQFIEDYKFG